MISNICLGYRTAEKEPAEQHFSLLNKCRLLLYFLKFTNKFYVTIKTPLWEKLQTKEDGERVDVK